MQESEDNKRQRRGRTQLLLIFVLFLLPPVSAYVAWKFLGSSGVESTTNAGTLVAPARPIQLEELAGDGDVAFDAAALRGRWTYVVFAPQTCDARCEQQLYLTRQIRIAMNKDIARVQRLLVLGAPPSAELAKRLADEHPDLLWAVDRTPGSDLQQVFTGQGFAPEGAQYFLLDPLGNLMMYYDLDVGSKGVMRDLQKLLKISQIG